MGHFFTNRAEKQHKDFVSPYRVPHSHVFLFKKVIMQLFYVVKIMYRYLDSLTMRVANVCSRSLLSAILPVFPLSSSTPKMILLSQASRVAWSKRHSSDKPEHRERTLELRDFSAVNETETIQYKNK